MAAAAAVAVAAVETTIVIVRAMVAAAAVAAVAIIVINAEEDTIKNIKCLLMPQSNAYLGFFKYYINIKTNNAKRLCTVSASSSKYALCVAEKARQDDEGLIKE